jgi:hypothetical protein
MLLKVLILSSSVMIASPAMAATVTDLGLLGTRTGSVSFPEASSYSSDDIQIARLQFSVSRPGTLNAAFGYFTQVRSPLLTICPEPEPESCYIEPSGNYQDFAGVRLQSFTLGKLGGPSETVDLPGGFVDQINGGPGVGQPSYGFDSVTFYYDLAQDFVIGAPGSYYVDLSGYGLIRGADFSGAGGGVVAYGLAFSSSVPEPIIWAMMLGGFGMVGGAMRSARRKQKVSISYA